MPEISADETQMNKGELYPPLMPYNTGYLEVDDTHTLYYEQCGNPDGVPVVILHGGPGSCTKPKHRRFFDPDYYRMILFDQRGCGQSTPRMELKDNTTEHLIADIEKLRAELNIEKWHVFGGSWGSTLGLAYGIAHPEVCASLILFSIFLLQDREFDWLHYGAKELVPDAWEEFAGLLPENERDNLLEGYYTRLMSDDEDVAIPAALAWYRYETALIEMTDGSEVTFNTDEEIAAALCTARMEAHYFRNNRFSPDNYLLENIERVRSIPGAIIHGRLDMCCPLRTAYELRQAWPEADFITLSDAGHSSDERSIRSALVMVGERMKEIAL